MGCLLSCFLYFIAATSIIIANNKGMSVYVGNSGIVGDGCGVSVGLVDVVGVCVGLIVGCEVGIVVGFGVGVGVGAMVGVGEGVGKGVVIGGVGNGVGGGEDNGFAKLTYVEYIVLG